jgi:hypothetical protein
MKLAYLDFHEVIRTFDFMVIFINKNFKITVHEIIKLVQGEYCSKIDEPVNRIISIR